MRDAVRWALGACARNRETMADDAALVKLSVTQRNAEFTCIDFWRQLAAGGRPMIAAQHLPNVLLNWLALLKATRALKYLEPSVAADALKKATPVQVRAAVVL